MNLHDRWLQLLGDCNVKASDGSALFEQLRECYSQPRRHYHNLNHLEQMFGWLAQAGVNEPSARWATWFHDAVYKPGQGDNEQRSAEWGRQAMQELSLPLDMVAHVEQIIQATKTHRSDVNDTTLCAVLDADMAILGSEPNAYRVYAENVRKEFAHIPDFFYRRGRRKFLQSVLESESIFQTPWFHHRFESLAKINIRDELKSL